MSNDAPTPQPPANDAPACGLPAPGAAPACGLPGPDAADPRGAVAPYAFVDDRPAPRGLGKFIENTFGVDLRSLALFRVGLALVLLGDLIDRAPDIKNLYTDWGVLPRNNLHDTFNDYFWSIHEIGGSVYVQGILFVLAGVFALMMLVGYRTRLATAASWFMLVSLHNRLPLVVQGGDILFRLLLFWGMFLPLGARFSLDSALNTAPAPAHDRNRFFSVGSLALVAQMFMLYVVSAVLKKGLIWWDGDAVYFALNLDIYARPLAVYIRQFGGLMRFLNHATLVIEIVVPFFLFVPVFSQWFRLAAVLVFFGLHLSFHLCMSIGVFPYVAIVAWFAMIPPMVWDTLFRRLSKPARLDIDIYYDGHCSFCKKTARILHTFFLLPQTRIHPAQSDPAMHELMNRENSWILRTQDGRTLLRFDAVVEVFRLSLWAFPVAWVLGLGAVRLIGDRLYRAVAHDRHLASQYVEWLGWRPIAAPGRSRFARSGDLLAAFFLAYVVIWNVRTTNFDKYNPYVTRFAGTHFNFVGFFFRVDQYWNMFAPNPLKADGWYVIPAKLIDGTTVDLFANQFRGGPVSYDKPADIPGTFRDNRWNKYVENLINPAHERQRLFFCRWLCRQWNERHAPDQRIVRMAIYRVVEMTLDPVYPLELDKTTDPPKPVLLRAHECGDAVNERGEVQGLRTRGTPGAGRENENPGELDRSLTPP